MLALDRNINSSGIFEAELGAAAGASAFAAAPLLPAFPVTACFHLTGSRTTPSFMQKQAQQLAA